MLIFDSFPSPVAAGAFAIAVAARFEREAKIYHVEEESQLADPIPVVLHAPTVLVERFALPLSETLQRQWMREEGVVIAYVRGFGGRFVGT